eukprot:scaffold87616_cov23-Cyclotella_meneghiniana.AAC.1
MEYGWIDPTISQHLDPSNMLGLVGLARPALQQIKGESMFLLGQKLGDILLPTVNVADRKHIAEVQGPTVCNNQLTNINILTYSIIHFIKRLFPQLVLRHNSLSTVLEVKFHLVTGIIINVPQGYITFGLIQKFHISSTHPISHYEYNEWLEKVDIGTWALEWSPRPGLESWLGLKLAVGLAWLVFHF